MDSIRGARFRRQLNSQQRGCYCFITVRAPILASLAVTNRKIVKSFCLSCLLRNHSGWLVDYCRRSLFPAGRHMPTMRGFRIGRWLAGRLMKELGLVSCQQPTYWYKRGGHEHIVISNRLSTVAPVRITLVALATDIQGGFGCPSYNNKPAKPSLRISPGRCCTVACIHNLTVHTCMVDSSKKASANQSLAKIMFQRRFRTHNALSD